MDDLLRKIANEKEIKNVLIDYCIAIDCMNLKLIESLFSENCIVEFGTDKALNSFGSKSLIKSLERMWRWERTSHHLSNVRISFIDSKNAISKSYVYAWHERKDQTTAEIFGQYHDIFIIENDKWVISKRKMYMNGSNREFKVKIYPFERKEPPKGWSVPNIDES